MAGVWVVIAGEKVGGGDYAEEGQRRHEKVDNHLVKGRSDFPGWIESLWIRAKLWKTEGKALSTGDNG